MKAKTTTKQTDQQVLLVEYNNGKQKRVLIPADATVTFGGLIPGAKEFSARDNGVSTALRVYQGKKQIAVFVYVKEFRMIERVSVMEKSVQRASKQVAYDDKGIQKFRTVNVESSEWVDPDTMQHSDEVPKLMGEIQEEF